MAGRHEWLPAEEFELITERILERHPHVLSHDIVFDGPLSNRRGETFYRLRGTVACQNDASLVVNHYLAARRGRRGVEEVRLRVFMYQGIRRGREAFRYDNSGGFERYHVHRWAADGSVLDDHAPLMRDQMPDLAEALDELRAVSPT